MARYKFRNMLALLDDLQARNVPIHGVGLQSHIFTRGLHDRTESIAFLREIQRRGLETSATEMDVTDNRAVPAPKDQDQAVAAIATEYLERMRVAGGVRTLVTWGLSDRYTWLRGKGHAERKLRPLPFDDALGPKALGDVLRDHFVMVACAGRCSEAPQ